MTMSGRAHGWSRKAGLSLARALGALGAVVALVGAGVVLTAAPAFASVTSNDYTIGTPSGAVSSVTVSPTSVGQGASTNFEVSFTAAASISGAAGNSVTLDFSEYLSSAPADVAFVDDSGSVCLQTGTSGQGGPGSSTVSELTVDLASNCTVEAGNDVQVDFTADAPSSTGSFDVSVTTSNDSTPATSNEVTVTTSGAVLSASSLSFGANVTYTITGVPVEALSADQNTVVLTGGVTEGTEPLDFYSGGAGGYTVTVTPANGTPVADAVTSAVTSLNGEVVTLTLADSLATGDTLRITALGTNPPATNAAQANDISVAPGNGTVVPTSSLTFGNSVSAVTVVPSVLAAGASASYVVSFKADVALPVGDYLFLRETDGPTNFTTVTGVLVQDPSRPWEFVASNVALADGSISIPLSDAVDAGDTVTLTIAGVTNPPAGTISDFAVTTTADLIPGYASPYTIGATTSSTGVVVTVDPSTVGAIASYTITHLVASAELVGGSGTISLDAPVGTVFPASPGYYSINDATTPSGSGTVLAPVAGGGTNDVTLTVPNTVSAGDALTITVQDVINPGVSSSTDTIAVLGNVTASTVPVVAVSTTFPQANTSYPNGAIVSFAGIDYVFAGGHAFEISTPAELASLQAVDHAAIVAAPTGAAVPTTPPRPGTLVFTRPVNGVATIFVVGTDGELHGFATPEQFVGDGYDPALVVTVTSLTGMTVGNTAGAEGAATNALGTSADGAIVDSSGTFYVFAGGRAFGVPTLASLETIRKADKATVLLGPVTSAQTSATLANGVLLSAAGPVYVSFNGELWPFKSEAQLDADGYAGTAAVPVPGTGGVTAMTSYTGS